MRTQKMEFPTRQVLCVFPTQPADLSQALSELHLTESYPVIVLIGGEIDAPQADATRQAIQTIARIAHEMNALILCGGTDMGIRAEIGQIHSKRGYTFHAVTVLINGGEVSRKDIELSLKDGRPVIALSRTGRLADELSRDPARDKLISIAPANADQRILDLIQAALSTSGTSVPAQ